MAKEIVEAIRQGEINANQMEKDAFTKKDAIILKAKEDKDALISSARKKALLEAEKALQESKEQEELDRKDALEKAEKKIAMLQEIVKGKEKAAIDLILSEVL